MRVTYRYILFFPIGKTLSYIKLLVSSIWPCKIRRKNTDFSFSVRWYECWAFCFSLESAGEELKNACLVKHMYWPQRVNCRALFIQVKKYKALHVVQQWSNKEDSKECPPCVIFRTQLLYFQYWVVRQLFPNTTVVREVKILTILSFQIQDFYNFVHREILGMISSVSKFSCLL